MKQQTASMQNLYTLNGKVPFFRSIPYGPQHVLAMLVAGLGTMLQLFSVWKFGARLPIVMGISFTFVSVTSSAPFLQKTVWQWSFFWP